MKRNRSIRTLPLDKLNLFDHPLPEALELPNNEKQYFGEKVRKGSAVFEKSSYLSSDDSDLILTSVRDIGNSKSSSSSLSWGEEYKSEASKQLRDELARMDRVLMGIEPIPENYDQEEYTEWMQFFPTLCVVGTKIGIHAEPTPKSFVRSEETLAVHPESNCDNFKETVIDQIYIKPPKITLDNSDIDDYLKVSRLPRRQSSSRSLISSQISSSKWLKDEEYNSLPFLSGARNGKGAPKSILKNSLVLPPIEISQFRSVSATPRRESKSLSALSVKDQKYSGFKRKVCK